MVEINLAHESQSKANIGLETVEFKNFIENFEVYYVDLVAEFTKILVNYVETGDAQAVGNALTMMSRQQDVLASVPPQLLAVAVCNYGQRCLARHVAVDRFDSLPISGALLAPTRAEFDQFYDEYAKTDVGLNFIVTDRCNITCDLCGPNCGPSLVGALSASDMSRIIEWAADRFNLVQVTFTGGEPTLYMRDVCAAATRARDVGCPHIRVVSNGSFGRSERTAHGVLSKLQSSGVTEIDISVDDFHLDYVSSADIRRTTRAAVSLKFPLNLAHKTYKGSLTGLAYFRQELNLPIESTEDVPRSEARKGIVTFSTGETQMIGRGKEKYETTKPAERGDWDGPCPEILKRVTVSPEGKFMPCCNIVDRRLPVFSKSNLLTDRETILSKANDTVLYAWLALEGPTSVLAAVENELPEFSGQCEACQFIFSSPQYLVALNAAIKKVVPRLIVKRALFDAFKTVCRTH